MVFFVSPSLKMQKCMVVLPKGNNLFFNLASVGAAPASKFSEDMKESYLRVKNWRNVSNIVELVKEKGMN